MKLFLILTFLLIFSFLFHLFTPSYLNNNKWPADNIDHYSKSLSEHYRYHTEFSVFKKRIVFTHTLQWLQKLTGVNVFKLYFPLQFFYLFVGGIVLIQFSKSLGLGFKIIALNLIGYFFTLSNLFHHFVPMYTYDELSQYPFALLALWAIYMEKYNVLGFLAVCMALLARESFFILFPFLCIFMFFSHGIKNIYMWKKIVIFFVIPTILYFFYLKIYQFKDVDDRILHFQRNLSSSRVFFTCLFGFMMNMCIPLLLIYINLKRNLIVSFKERLWYYAFLGTTILNGLIVMFTTQAWESRLFVIPLYMFWPFMGLLIGRFFTHLKTINAFQFPTIRQLIFALVVSVISYFSYYHYDSTFRIGYSIYFAIYMFIFSQIIIIYLNSKKFQVLSKSPI